MNLSRFVAAVALAFAAPAAAQVPPDIAARIKATGPVIDTSITSTYAALLPREPYPGVEITRDQAFGKDRLQRLDVYTLQSKARVARPVLIYVHGGGFTRGDKRERNAPFADNILVWAVRNGMVGVNMNYRLAPRNKYPAGAQDVASAIAWTRDNIASYGGDPERIYVWGFSAGAVHLTDYLSHPELQGAELAGVKGAVLLSPMYRKDPPTEPQAYYGTDMDAQLYGPAVARLTKVDVPIFLAGAEYDPPGFVATREGFRDELCKAGKCPTFVVLKDHNHMSSPSAVGTKDQSLTGPLLAWLQRRR